MPSPIVDIGNVAFIVENKISKGFSDPLPIIPHIYRFMEKRWAYELLEEGKIQIKPLYNYHKIEEFSPSIGDKTEGEIHELIDVEYNPVLNPKHPFIEYSKRRKFIQLSGFINMKLSNVTYIDRCPNCYILCFTKLKEPPNKECFGDADTCLRVKNSTLLTSVISELIGAVFPERITEYFKTDYCKYISKKRFYLDGIKNSPFLKENRIDFRQQQEIRAVWALAPENDLTILNLQDNRLKNCFELA